MRASTGSHGHKYGKKKTSSHAGQHGGVKQSGHAAGPAVGMRKKHRTEFSTKKSKLHSGKGA